MPEYPNMSPLFRSLFVFSIFSVIAAHVSTGALEGIMSQLAPQVSMTLDKTLNTLLVGTLGQEMSVYVLLAVGAFFAFWAYMAGLASGRSRRPERYSTW